MSSNKYRITIVIESLLLAIALGLGVWWYVHNKVVREVEKSFEDGSAYTGEWLAGKMNGLGVLTLADGEVYEGSFVDGRKCGQGFPRHEGYGHQHGGADPRGPRPLDRGAFRVDPCHRGRVLSAGRSRGDVPLPC